MAQLPPKIPNMTPHWPDFSSQKLTATTVQNPSWVDEFLDFSACRRGNHRRSISDSIAFLEAPFVRGHGSNEHQHFDRFDDEQFMSMFKDYDDVHNDNNPSHDNNNTYNNVRPTGSSSNTSTLSDHNSFNGDKEPPSDQNTKHNDEVHSQCKKEPEDGTASNNNSDDSSVTRILDPKRVKR